MADVAFYPPQPSQADESSEEDDRRPRGKRQQSAEDSERPTKLKPAAGPVKQACLTCRAKKAKCDGLQPICTNCDRKGLSCEYVKSRRGGARKKRTTQDVLNEPLAAFLKRLEDLSHYTPHQGFPPSQSGPSNDVEVGDTPVDMIVRTFASGEAILEAYYIEIYPQAPLLPASGTVPLAVVLAALHSGLATSSFASGSSHFDFTATSKDCSHLLLSILAILVLAPHPQDPAPSSPNSRALRRRVSARYAAESFKLVDDAVNTAGEAGTDPGIKTVQTLNLLAIWEQAQASNYQRLRQRVGQAIQIAMDLRLHESDAHMDFGGPDNEWRRDMRRRTWWFTFAMLCHGSLTSGTLPSIHPYDTRVTADFPTCLVDSSAWPSWISILRQLVRAFEVMVAIDQPQARVADPVRISGPSDASPPVSDDPSVLYREVVAIDRHVLEMLRSVQETSIVELKYGVDAEAEMVRNFQLLGQMMLNILEIAIHRRTAVPEIAFFSKKMFGLPVIGTGDGYDPRTKMDQLSQFLESSLALDDPLSTSPQPSSQPSSSTASRRAAEPSLTTAIPSTFASTGMVATPSSNSSGSRDAFPSFGVFADQQQQQQAQPISSSRQPYEFDFSLDTLSSFNSQPDISSSFGGPVPSLPWFSTEGGARYMVLPVQQDPYSSSAMLESTGRAGPFGSLSMPAIQSDPSVLYNDPSLWQAAPPSNLASNRTSTFPSPSTSVPIPTHPDPPRRQSKPPQSSSHVDRLLPSHSLSARGPAYALGQKPGPAPAILPWNAGSNLAPDSQLKPSVSHTRSTKGGSASDRSNKAATAAVRREVTAALASADYAGPFPPGLSLARTSAGAHSIFRLEVMHRAAAFSMADSSGRHIPFAACGLNHAAYAFLLLSVAIQAEENFSVLPGDTTVVTGDGSTARASTLNQLFLNVEIIIAGLSAYGRMWDGIQKMADEVRSALTAAKSLAQEINERRIKLARSPRSRELQFKRYEDAAAGAGSNAAADDDDDVDAHGEEDFDLAGSSMPPSW